MSRWDYTFSRVVTAASERGLITLDQAKIVLGIDAADTTHDAEITLMIASISAGISTYCDRLFVVQTYRDQYRNASADKLRARQYPIALATGGDPELFTVTIDGAVITPDQYDLDVTNGWLYPIAGWWSGVLIVLDYKAGYNPIPADVQAAANEWLTMRWAAKGYDPTLRSEEIPDLISVAYQQQPASGSDGALALPQSVAGWLEGFRYWSV
jgi:hypothetical protein